MGLVQITLNVSDENLGDIVTILNSLKDGLIKDMKVQTIDNKIDSKTTRYQPPKRVIKEQQIQEVEKMGKYISPAEFKKRLKKF